jgi:hypothetical protein
MGAMADGSQEVTANDNGVDLCHVSATLTCMSRILVSLILSIY